MKKVDRPEAPTPGPSSAEPTKSAPKPIRAPAPSSTRDERAAPGLPPARPHFVAAEGTGPTSGDNHELRFRTSPSTVQATAGAEGATLSNTLSKKERLQLFLKALADVPDDQRPSTHDEAFALIATTLNRIEDAHSGVPYNPDTWQTDGRMYPPQLDARRSVQGFTGVTRYRSKGHNTFIGDNGAIEIASIPAGGGVLDGRKVFVSVPGRDGRDVWSQAVSRD